VRDEISDLIAEIHEAAGALRMSGAEIAKAEGVTLTQWHVLDAIADPTFTVARVARRIGLSRQAVQKVANELESGGLITFVPNPDHKTSPLIRITSTGHATQERVWARATKSHRARFGALSDAELSTTQQTLRQIIDQTYMLHGQGPTPDM
jgi:DNA-binding MarR family transcriptional regulator